MDPPRRFDLNYSLKNIPIPSPSLYTEKLIEKVESLIRRMRWRAFFFLKSGNDDGYRTSSKETYGFKSRKCPPQSEELEAFEEDLLKMVETIQFRKTTNEFQQRLRKDVERIRQSKDVIVPADKTRNLYAVRKDQYEKLLQNNITKNYKTAEPQTYIDINREAQGVAQDLELSDRIECMAKRGAYITLKDHKNNFGKALPCRLINPAKTEIGIISKSILDNILSAIQRRLDLNMWKSTNAVTNWFRSIPEKQRCTFVSFDIVDFYPSISKELLERALDFASQYATISDRDRQIIMHARKSMLFGLGQEWVKQSASSELFDVTMGCHDGAEVCELVGAFALATLSRTMKPGEIGLYRDDGLGVVRGASGHQTDRLRKDIIKFFADLGLKITIEINLKTTNFLDITLDLATERYYPYRKPNDRPLYVHRQSNHPPAILRNLPASISRRLTDISSDRKAYAECSPLYDHALQESGYCETTEYLADRKEAMKSNNKSHRRKRNITWFNPPYSANVATQIGRKFRSLVARHFPKGSRLHKIFNGNTLKLSYSCMPNMAAAIKQHNNKVLREAPPKRATGKMCNCRQKSQCPLDGACLEKSIIYKAVVSTEQNEKEYIGLTATDFKARFTAHQHSFRHRKHQHSTALSRHIWALKDSNTAHKIKWSVLRRAAAYNSCTQRCNLCQAEKLAIISSDKARSLNKRSELVSKCRHANKFLLQNFPPPLT